MADSVFVDSNVFIAAANGSDNLHARAISVLEECARSGDELITSNYVVSEALTILSMRGSKKLALSFAEIIYNSSSAIVRVNVDPEIEHRALELFSIVTSKNISFCDCVSVAIVELYRIPVIASFGADFKKFKERFIIRG
ncbi:MAG: PIN domain-containing protein [bacterium]|nr:PIN domain-containing protein [bacterium]